MVLPAAADVPVHLVPCPSFSSLPAPCRGVPGLLQHAQAGQIYQRQRHAAARSAHVLRFCKLRGHSQSIHLPRQEYPAPPSYDTMLRGGNTQPTIPYHFRTQRGRARWAADTRPDASNDSRLYELNLRMWRYGRRQECNVSILDAIEARARMVREARARAGESVKRRRLAARDGALWTRRRDSRRFASCFAPVRATCTHERQRGKGRDQR